MHRRTPVLAVAACLTSIALAAHAMSGGGGKIQVNASASPALGAFSFESTDVKVSEADGKLVFVTQLEGMSMGLRKAHTKEAFEISKHPTAKLSVPKDKLKIPAAGATEKGSVPAELTLHGVTLPVNVKYTATESGGGFKVGGSFAFQYQDFKVGKKCRREGKGEDDKLPECDEDKIKACKPNAKVCYEQICKVGVCVDPEVRIVVDGVKVNN
ncbi:MAG: YceI family protein [Myxococcota bacterium]